MEERPHDEPTHTLPPLQRLSDIEPVPTPASGPKRLYRSRDRRLFMGVCGGLAEYFDIDPTLVRAVFALTTLLGGASIVVYAVLLVIMPAEDQLDTDPRAAAQRSLDEALAEVQRGVGVVVDKAKSVTGRNTPPPSSPSSPS